MITHFSDKVWLVIFEQSTGGYGCRQYGVHGIFNKKNLAENALKKLDEISMNNSRIGYSIKEVNMKDKIVLFDYFY